MFSIIIPLYNAQNFINKTLDSIKNQKNYNSQFEVIVYDDNSTDNSLSLVKKWNKYNGGLINIIEGNKNKGPAYARNKMIDSAKGDIIISLDSDDFLSENTLTSVENFFLNNPDLEFMYSSHNIIDITGNYIETRRAIDFSSKELLHYNLVTVGLKSYSKSIWDQVNGFDEDLFHGEDWDFILNIDYKVKSNQIKPLKEPLYNYRKWNNSISKISKASGRDVLCDKFILERALKKRNISFSNIERISPYFNRSYYYDW